MPTAQFNRGDKVRITSPVWFLTDTGRDSTLKPGTIVEIIDNLSTEQEEAYDVEITSGYHAGRRMAVTVDEIEPAGRRRKNRG